MKKLTVAELQAQLELLKSSKSTGKSKVHPVTETHKSSVAHDIKNSYIQNLHMKSSMFMLWLATAVLSYAHKIPYIKYIISALSLVYGRTTIWKVLIKLRKLFITFNAIIGVYMVFKTVGFSYDNILAGFVGMGHSYLEILGNFTKRLFNWFVELFDHKVIPNVPGDNGSLNKNIWLPKGIESNSYYPKPNLENSLRESYKSLLNIHVEPSPTSWYKDYSTWLWIVGGVIVVYLGYKFIVDPLFIQDLGSGTVTARQSPIDGVAGPSNGPDITIADNRGGVTKSIGETIRQIKTRLNPFNWIAIGSETGLNSQGFKNFMEKQNTMETAERRLYPFTTTNPYLPWLDQLRINLFGESVFENLKRFKDMELADRVANNLSVSNGQFIDIKGATPNIWAQTAASTNFATPVPQLTWVDTLHSYNIQNKLNSIPSTPTIVPTVLPAAENILSDVSEWKSFDKETFTENTDKWLQTWKGGKAASSSTMQSIEIPLTPNKFSVLEVDIE